MIITQAILDDLTRQTKSSPRLRMAMDFLYICEWSLTWGGLNKI